MNTYRFRRLFGAASSAALDIARDRNIQAGNVVLNGIEYLLKRRTLISRPVSVVVMPSGRCNTSCIMCPNTYIKSNREIRIESKDNNARVASFLRQGHFAEEEMSRATISKLAPYMKMCMHGAPYFYNEPFCTSRTWEVMDHFSDNTYLRLTTNALALTPKTITRLLGYRNLRIFISVNGTTPETYRITMGAGLSMEKMMRSVKDLLSREHHGSMESTIRFTVMRINHEEIPAVLDLARDLGVGKVEFSLLGGTILPGELIAHSQGYSFDYGNECMSHEMPEVSSLLQVAKARGREYGIDVEINFNHRESDYYPADLNLCDCEAPWRNLIVLPNGNLVVCCNSDNHVLNVEEIPDGQPIWNSPAMIKLRDDLAKNRLNPYCQGATCEYVRNLSRPDFPA